MTMAGILLIVIPFVLLVAALAWAAGRARTLGRGPAVGFRIITAYFVVGGGCGAAAVGIFAHDIGPSLTIVALGGASLALTALMMRDGRLLARARPLDRWEVRWLRAGVVSAAAAGLAIVIVAAATHRAPPAPLLGVGFGVGVATGALAAASLVRA